MTNHESGLPQSQILKLPSPTYHYGIEGQPAAAYAQWVGPIVDLLSRLHQNNINHTNTADTTIATYTSGRTKYGMYLYEGAWECGLAAALSREIGTATNFTATVIAERGADAPSAYYSWVTPEMAEQHAAIEYRQTGFMGGISRAIRNRRQAQTPTPAAPDFQLEFQHDFVTLLSSRYRHDLRLVAPEPVPHYPIPPQAGE